LAEECGHPEPGLFHHEIVFEWAIPEKYVLHKISLQTSMDRGLKWEKYLIQGGRELQLLSTAELRSCIARDLQPARPWYGSWEIGVRLAGFARKFGARAPLDWIAYRLFYDCVRRKIVDEDVIRVNYAHGHSETVDFDFFCELDHGIEIGLYDWWLADIDFFLDHEEFKEWRDAMEDGWSGMRLSSGKPGTMLTVMKQSERFLKRKRYCMTRHGMNYRLSMKRSGQLSKQRL
jgi:hypothetical protein